MSERPDVLETTRNPGFVGYVTNSVDHHSSEGVVLDFVDREENSVEFVSRKGWEIMEEHPQEFERFMARTQRPKLHLLYVPGAKHLDTATHSLFRNSIVTDGFRVSYDRGPEHDAEHTIDRPGDVRDEDDHHGPEKSRYKQRSASLMRCEKIASGAMRKFIKNGRLDLRDVIDHIDEDSVLHYVLLEIFDDLLRYGMPVEEVEKMFAPGTRLHTLVMNAGMQDTSGGGSTKISRKMRMILKKLMNSFYRLRDGKGIAGAKDLRAILDAVRFGVDAFVAGDDSGLPLEDDYDPAGIQRSNGWIMVPLDYVAADGTTKRIHPDARATIHERENDILAVFQKANVTPDGRCCYSIIDWRGSNGEETAEEPLPMSRVYELLNVAENLRRRNTHAPLSRMCQEIERFSRDNARLDIYWPWNGNEMGGSGNEESRSLIRPEEMPLVIDCIYKIVRQECATESIRNRIKERRSVVKQAISV